MYHVAWAGAASRGSASLEVPAALADCLGLVDGQQVWRRSFGTPHPCLPLGTVVRSGSTPSCRFGVGQVQTRVLEGVPLAESVAVDPAGADDWERTELNAEFLEAHLLQQVALVERGRSFPLWLHGGAPLRLAATGVEPGPVARLGQGTELVVAPRLRLPPPGAASAPTGPARRASGKAAWVRVAEAGAGMCSHLAGELSTWCTLFVLLHPDAFAPPPGWLTPGQEVLLLPPNPPAAAAEGGDEGEGGGGSVTPTLFAIPSEAVPHGHVGLSPPLRRLLGARPGSRLQVQPLATGPPPATHADVTLMPLTEHSAIEQLLEHSGAPPLPGLLAAWLRRQLGWANGAAAGARPAAEGAPTLPHGAVLQLAAAGRSGQGAGLQALFRVEVASGGVGAAAGEAAAGFPAGPGRRAPSPSLPPARHLSYCPPPQPHPSAALTACHPTYRCTQSQGPHPRLRNMRLFTLL